MGQKIGTEKISREDGYLYYIGKDGYVWAAPMKHNKRGKKKKVGSEKISKQAASCTTSARTATSTRPS